MQSSALLIKSYGRYLRVSRKPFESLVIKHSKNALQSFSTLIPFKLADIGEGIAEVELMKWFVKEGDEVKSFDRICEVQSDKATVEITSRYDGKVVRVHYAEGAIVKVGSSLIDIQAASDTGSQAKLANEYLPEPSSNESTIVGKEMLVDDMRFADGISQDKILTTPAVRKLSKENHIDLATIKGTGPRGRILKEDILAHIYKSGGISTPSTSKIEPVLSARPMASTNSNNSSVTRSASPPAQALAVHTEDKRIAIRGIQRLMVKSMNAANQVKHLTLGEEVCCDRLISLRKSLKAIGSKRNIKISYMPIMIKAASLALMDYPMLNATVNEDASEMIQHVNHNIGVAMDTPTGLIVPVIKQVQNKSIFEIAEELSVLQVSYPRLLPSANLLSFCQL
jgi:2-oxoisovalerate dehydrogenase E2 component (dihydrolipoyl transacylase)